MYFRMRQMSITFLSSSKTFRFKHFNIGDDTKNNKWWIQTTFGSYPLDSKSFELLVSKCRKIFVVQQHDKVIIANFYTSTFEELLGDVYTDTYTKYVMLGKQLYIMIGYRNHLIKRIMLLTVNEEILDVRTFKGKIKEDIIIKLMWKILKLKKLL